ncbi:MAG: hypothetical protein KDI38_04975 [Calditrichaeota bacterium]|nr:hypothetical protein [Calditrichota bacterium]MCB0303109.1 hypothetical protein [Calditrichota bacterium]MCB0313876.1 hypothetical protein [Calditrichota bacterium]
MITDYFGATRKAAGYFSGGFFVDAAVIPRASAEESVRAEEFIPSPLE